eukprot:RCo005004
MDTITVVKEIAITESVLQQLAPMVEDPALLAFGLCNDSRQLTQTHPKLNRILHLLLSVVRSQNSCIDRLWQQSSDTAARMVVHGERHDVLSNQLADLRSEVASDRVAHSRRRSAFQPRPSPRDLQVAVPSPTFPAAPSPAPAGALQLSPTMVPPVPLITAASGVGSSGDEPAGEAEAEAEVPEVGPELGDPEEVAALQSAMEEKLREFNAKIEEQRQKLSQDFDLLVLDVNNAAEVSCKDVNEELRRIHKAYTEWSAAEKSQLEQRSAEMQAMLLEHVRVQKELLDQQQAKLSVMAQSHNKLRTEINELRAIVLAEQGKSLLRDTRGVASATDLAAKADRAEVEKLAEEQGTMILQLREQMDSAQDKVNAMREVLAVTSGGKVLSEALHTRFATITNELHRLDKSKADRIELQELAQKLAVDSTVVSVKCLSCNRTADHVNLRGGAPVSDFTEFPPNALCMNSWNPVTATPAGGPAHPDITPDRAHRLTGPTTRRKVTAPTPSSTKSFGVPRDPPPRRKLQNFYDWLKTRTEEEAYKRAESPPPGPAPELLAAGPVTTAQSSRGSLPPSSGRKVRGE